MKKELNAISEFQEKIALYFFQIIFTPIVYLVKNNKVKYEKELCNLIIMIPQEKVLL